MSLATSGVTALRRALSALRGAVVTAGLGVIVVAMAGCAADPPLIPPAELQSIESPVVVDRLWNRSFDDDRFGRFLPWIDDDALYVATSSGLVRRLERDSGRTVWQTDVDLRLASGVSGNDQQIFVSSSNGDVIALDASSGDEEWRSRVSSEVLAPVSAGFGTVVVRSADGRVVALEPGSGAERWSSSNETPALTLHGYSRPLLVDGGVLVGLDDGRILALDLASGRRIWETVLSLPSGRSEVERLVDVDADIRVDSDAIYAVSYQGKAARLEPGRGQLDWSIPLSSSSGLELFEERLVLVDEEDELVALDKDSGSVLWRQDALRGRRLSPPAALDDNRVVVGDFEGYVHVLDIDEGRVLGRRRHGDVPIETRPVPTGRPGEVLVQASDGSIALFSVGN